MPSKPQNGHEYAVSSQNAKIYKSHYLQNVNPIKPKFKDKAATTIYIRGWATITLNQIQHG